MESKNNRSPAYEIVSFLSKKYPNTFVVENLDSKQKEEPNYKPLKIGIFKDISDALFTPENEPIEHSFSKKAIRVALRYYTTRWGYLESVKEGVKRVNLNGEEDEVVTKEHEEHAQATLTEAKEKVKQANEAKKAKLKAKNGEKKNFSKKSFPRKPFNKNNNGSYNKFNKHHDNRFARKEESVEFVELAANDIVVGKHVHVKLSNSVASATVKEIKQDQVTVEISNGMVIKVNAKNIGR